MRQEITAESVRGGVAVGGTLATTLTLNEWIAVGTGIYIAVQVVYLLRKWWREEKDWRRKGRRA